MLMRLECDIFAQLEVKLLLKENEFNLFTGHTDTSESSLIESDCVVAVTGLQY